MSGGAPTRVRSAIEDRSFLVDFFLNLFEVTHTEDSVRRALPDEDAGTTMQREMESAAGSDFRLDVERWLSHVMR